MIRFLIILIGSACLLPLANSGDNPSAGSSPEEFKKLFDNFFSNATSQTYFQKFVEEGRRVFKMEKGDKSEPEKADKSKEAKDGHKNPNSPPLPAKVFAFYGKAYGCQHAKVYKEYLTDVKNNDPSFPIVPMLDPQFNDTWLIKMAEGADTITTDEDTSISLSDAQTKLDGLVVKQKETLDEGEAEMPISAKIYIHFIKVFGCIKINEDKYSNFKGLLKQKVDSRGNATKTSTTKVQTEYWLKATDYILSDIKIQA